MEGHEIENILNNSPGVKDIFRGVYSSDTLPKINKNEFYPCGFISNTDKADEPGEHWVAYFIESKNSLPEYFDSFGLPPLNKDLMSFLPDEKFKYSDKCIQNILSSFCGYYAIYFILFRSNNYSYENILKHFKEDTKLNDSYVNEFIQNLIKKFLIESKTKKIKSQTSLPLCNTKYCNFFHL